jgi:hypothetical protein
MEINSSIPVKGMNLDSITSQKGDGIYSLMFNGLTESDDHKYTASNEPANVKLVNLPDGYFLIGHVRINNTRIFVFLVNPVENKSQIGYFDHVEDPELDQKILDATNLPDVAAILSTTYGEYNPLVESTESNAPYRFKDDTSESYATNLLDEESVVITYPSPQANIESGNAVTPYVTCNCLNFKITSPIYHAVYKPNLCNDRIYWTDGLNPPRFLVVDNIEGEASISNLQRVTANDGTLYCPPNEFLNELDCDKIRIFRLVNQPDINIVDIQENGSIPTGSVQFSIAYTDKVNNRLTRFYDITNPVYIIDDSYSASLESVQGNPFNLTTNKSVKLKIDNFDPKYSYYQLGIIENINGSKNIYQIGPYPTDRTEFIYTGNEQQKQRLSFDEFYQQRPVYEKADGITTIGDKLGLYGLSTNNLGNFQRVANKIKLNWQTVAVPYVLPEYTYKGGEFSSNYRSYMRGEVYPFGIVFEFADGTDSPIYHIPGREASSYDTEVLTNTNNNDLIQNDPCVTDPYKRWQVYDTSEITETFQEFQNIENGDLSFLETDSNFVITESASQRFDIKFDSMYELSVIQDSSTLINDTDGTNIVFAGNLNAAIKFEKDTNNVKIRLNFRFPNNNIKTTDYYDIEDYTIREILDDISVSKWKDNNFVAVLNSIETVVGYGTTITTNSNQGSEYIAFALDRLFRDIFSNTDWTVKDSTISYNINPKGPLLSGYDNGVAGINNAASAGDAIRKFVLAFNKNIIDKYYISTRTTAIPITGIIPRISISNGSLSMAQTMVNNFKSKYQGSSTEYITTDAIEKLRASGSSTFTNNVDSDIVEGSTIISNPANQDNLINSNVYTGYVTVTTNWTITLAKDSINLFTLKSILQCNKVPHKKGKFAYWESTERYPCDDDVWGELSGQPIRHHKFPTANKISHFENIKSLNESYRNLEEDLFFIMPIGIAVDHQSIVNAFVEVLKNPSTYPNLTKEQILKIKGYKIVRGNRVNDASIVAKGLLYDVWEHDKKLGKDFTKRFYYSNYPYNDLRPDPFILTSNSHYLKTNYNNQQNDASANKIKHPYHTSTFNYGIKNNRFTFLSPETLFAKPRIDGYLLIDQEQTGLSQGHFTPVLDHSKYQRLRAPGYVFSAFIGNTISLISSLQVGTSFKVDLANYVGSYIPLRDKFREFLKLGIPLTNYAYQYTSTGNYNTYRSLNLDTGVNSDVGDYRRRIDIIQYLRRDIENVGDTYQFNNLDRETSLYLKLNNTIKSPRVLDTSRYKWSDVGATSPEQITTQSISSYYAVIKRDLPDQYGLISTVQYCFTGVKYRYDQLGLQGYLSNTIYSDYPDGYSYDNVYGKIVFGAGQEKDTIFGGDTFIGRFAVKRKHNYFLTNRRGFPDNTDVNYSDVPNVGYPTFFFDTNTRLFSEDDGNELSITNAQGYDGNSASSVNSATTTGTGTNTGPSEIIRTFKKLIQSTKNIFKSLQNAPNDFFDYPQTSWTSRQLGHTGQMYIHSYGVPYFFVESIINVDLRHRGTNSWEDFYPHVERDIPDNWLQEDIKYDEFFGYNRDFSAQNTDNPLLPLQLNYNPLETCFDYMPNRIAYSQQSNYDELIDNYLLFRVNDYADFGYDYGYLKNIAFLPGEKTLVQFENGTKLFSSFSTLEPANSTKPIYLGSGTLFQQGITLSDSEVGYAGNQNRAFILTELGAVWLDVKRGSVFSFGGGINEISLNNKNWFKSNLPFNIIKDFPEMYTDNPFHNLNPVGITMAYDNKYQRVIITKHDFKLKRPSEINVIYDSTTKKFYRGSILPEYEISLKDTTFFINKSWTISYSFLNKEWISFHSYTPNTYISLNQRFLSTNISGTTQSFWTHNQTNKAYQVVYGSLVEYILEFPYYLKGATNILGSIMMYSESLRYSGQDDYAQNLSYFFNKCVIWNKYQTTGLLNLIWDDPNDDTLAIDYPIYNNTGINILYSSKDDSYTFNHIWNVLNAGKGVWAESLTNPIVKGLNLTTEEYAKPQDEMDRMRGKESFVRMIQDAEWKYKFKVYLQVEKQNPSIY